MHILSCTSLFVYFCGGASTLTAVKFETALLLIKWTAEILTGQFTKDLLMHHLCMLGAAAAVNYFPQHAFLVVYVQAIHLPLAVNYSRRLSHKRRGSIVDQLFVVLWFLAVAARNTMLLRHSGRAIWNGDGVRWVLPPLALPLAVLDVMWTQDTLHRRERPWLSGTAAAIVGSTMGFFSGEPAESSHVCVAWAAAAALALVLSLASLASRIGSAALKQRPTRTVGIWADRRLRGVYGNCCNRLAGAHWGLARVRLRRATAVSGWLPRSPSGWLRRPRDKTC